MDNGCEENSVEHTLQECSTSLGVLGAACFVISSFTGVAIGVFVTLVFKNRSQKKREKIDTTKETPNPCYDYINPVEDGFDTSQNMSYIPQLPKPRKKADNVQ